jgi:hypothetical protein
LKRIYFTNDFRAILRKKEELFGPWSGVIFRSVSPQYARPGVHPWHQDFELRNWEDILPSNLYTHSILNVVYQTYEQIEHKYGSILKLTTDLGRERRPRSATCPAW